MSTSAPMDDFCGYNGHFMVKTALQGTQLHVRNQSCTHVFLLLPLYCKDHWRDWKLWYLKLSKNAPLGHRKQNCPKLCESLIPNNAIIRLKHVKHTTCTPNTRYTHVQKKVRMFCVQPNTPHKRPIYSLHTQGLSIRFSNATYTLLHASYTAKMR